MKTSSSKKYLTCQKSLCTPSIDGSIWLINSHTVNNNVSYFSKQHVLEHFSEYVPFIYFHFIFLQCFSSKMQQQVCLHVFLVCTLSCIDSNSLWNVNKAGCCLGSYGTCDLSYTSCCQALKQWLFPARPIIKCHSPVLTVT